MIVCWKASCHRSLISYKNKKIHTYADCIFPLCLLVALNVKLSQMVIAAVLDKDPLVRRNGDLENKINVVKADFVLKALAKCEPV